MIYKIGNVPDYQISKDLLNNYYLLLDTQSQNALLGSLRPSPEPVTVSFIRINFEESYLTTNLQGRPQSLPNVNPNSRRRLQELCNNLSLMTEKRISYESIITNQSHIRVIDGEIILFRATLENSLSIDLTLDVVSLRFCDDSDTSFRHFQVEPISIFIPALGTTSATLSFKCLGTISAKLVGLFGNLNEQPIFFHIENRGPRLNYTKRERISKTYDNNPRLCLSVIKDGPRLEIEVEDPSKTFMNMDIQTTVIIKNTGDKETVDCRLYAAGLESFPTEGMEIGIVGISSSVGIPLAYSADDSPIFLTGEKDYLDTTSYWAEPHPLDLQKCISMSAKTVENIMLLSIRNETDRFLLQIHPSISTQDAQDPSYLDIAPNHIAVFAFHGNSRPDPIETMVLVDCTIADEPIRFFEIFTLSWEPSIKRPIFDREILGQNSAGIAGFPLIICESRTRMDINGVKTANNSLWRSRVLGHLSNSNLLVACSPGLIQEENYVVYCSN